MAKKQIKILDKTRTVRAIILASTKQTEINLNMDVFRKRKTDPEFLTQCANTLNIEPIYKHI